MDGFDKINWKWWLGILGINLFHLLIHYLDSKPSAKVNQKNHEAEELNQLIVKINQDNQEIAKSFDKLHQETMVLIKCSPQAFKISNSAVRSFWKLAAHYPKHHFDRHTTDKEIIRHQNELHEYHQQVLSASKSILELRYQENMAQFQKLNDNHQLTYSRVN